MTKAHKCVDDRLIISFMMLDEDCEFAIEKIKAAFASIAEKSLRFGCGPALEDSERDPLAELIRALNAIGGDIDKEKLQELAEFVEDMPPIIQKKIPHPPKYIGPINKANYTANKPPRRARSNCRIFKHR